MPSRTGLRLFYFDLGVPYHVARIYGDGRENAVLSPDQPAGLNFIAEFLHSFRMEAFFVVAGFFSLLILQREAVWKWFEGRIFRVLVPLVACSLLFAPIMNYIFYQAALFQGDPNAQMSSKAWTIMHLWFLHALWMLTCALVVVTWLVRKFEPIERGVQGLAGTVMQLAKMPFYLGALALVLPTALWWLAAPASVPFIPMFFINKAWLFAPFFLVGCLMAARQSFRDWFLTWDLRTLAMAIGFSLLFVWGATQPAYKALAQAVGAAGAGYYWLSVILAFGQRYLNRPTKWVQHLCDASFTVYLFHFPIALLLGLQMLGWKAPPVVEWAILVGLASSLSLLLHGLISRSKWLSLLFNGVRLSKYKRR